MKSVKNISYLSNECQKQGLMISWNFDQTQDQIDQIDKGHTQNDKTMCSPIK